MKLDKQFIDKTVIVGGSVGLLNKAELLHLRGKKVKILKIKKESFVVKSGEKQYTVDPCFLTIKK